MPLKRRQIFSKWIYLDSALARIEENFNSLSDISRPNLECFLDRGEELWKDIRVTVEEAINQESLDDLTPSFENLESRYMHFKSQCRSELAKLSEKTHVVKPSPMGCLPHVKLPTFSGMYDQFMQFHDIFLTAVVENHSLSPIEKYMHLLSHLKGEPFMLVSALNVSGDNFHKAWELLVDRYSNKTKIIDTHVKALLNLPQTKSGSASLKQFISQISTNWCGLKSISLDVDLSEVILQHLILSKLDFKTRESWYLSKDSARRMPGLQELVDFLNHRANALEFNEDISQKSQSNSVSVGKPHQATPNPRAFAISVYDSSQCILCPGKHPLFKCVQFHQLTVQERLQVCRKHSLCMNCLLKAVKEHPCSKKRCRMCNMKHHSLLHDPNPRKQAMNSNITSKTDVGNITNVQSQSSPDEGGCSVVSTEAEEAEKVFSHMAFSETKKFRALLPTAIILVTDKTGNHIPVRALLDSGSEICFITEALVQLLNIQRTKCNYSVHSVNYLKSGSNGKVNVTIKSRFNDWQTGVQCLIVPSISSKLPQIPIDLSKLKIPKQLKLADDTFHLPNKIDMLLNSSVFFEVFKAKISLPNDTPAILDTLLGSVIAGTVQINECTLENKTKCFFLLEEQDALTCNKEFDMQRIWNETDKNEFLPTLNSEDSIHPTEAHFIATTRRLPDGQFSVSLPFKADPGVLGRSYHLAKQFMLSLEHRFQRDKKLKGDYIKFMREYIALGHAEECSDARGVVSNYIPHFCVQNPNSLTTKLRIVFHASVKTTSGHSLNDILWAGPNVQPELIDILLRFRIFNCAFAADIEKMYRMVRLNEEHTNYQKILWREQSSAPLKSYKLKTVTYGLASSAFLATRCLKQIAINNEAAFPEAALAITNSFYVDDLLHGAESAPKAIHLFKQISDLLLEAHFKLRKFRSNDDSMINTLLGESPGEDLVALGSDQAAKILGLAWHSGNDTLHLAHNVSTQPVGDCGGWTKRKVLHIIASIYDPLGLVTPVTIRFKIFLQLLWEHKLNWDACLPRDLITQWETLLTEVPLLTNLIFPRKVTCSGASSVILTGFADASLKAYGCCVYVISENLHGGRASALMASKSKLAPLAGTTIPRLELCGAVLLAKFMMKIYNAVSLICKINSVYLFTDSTVVLHWIQHGPTKSDTFIANRIAAIRKCSQVEDWLHISSKDNPADLISRGVTARALASNNRWFHGPEWMIQPFSQWNSVPEVAESGNVQLLLHSQTFLTTTCAEEKHILLELIRKFNSYHKLLRITAYCCRFIYQCRCRTLLLPKKTGPLSTTELRKALLLIVNAVQKESFSVEYAALSNKSHIAKNSKILNLHPFMDKDGIIRVGGRLGHSLMSQEVKHQIILPRDHAFTKALVNMIHLTYLHAGCQLTVSIIRQRFWIPSIRRIVNSVIHYCLPCIRWRARPASQVMSGLPASRTTQSKPWEFTSVDYCGPFITKPVIGRCKARCKSWVVVFICHATKAIHLDVVENLTTNEFIAALKRFGSRRGFPRIIYSDNAKTFVKAKNQLAELSKIFTTQQEYSILKNFLAVHGVEWRFCPPRSPFRNGLAEAAVGSLKHHLKRSLGQNCISLSELRTLLTQIEHILNSRPLMVHSEKDTEAFIITPNHLIYGHSLNSLAFDQESKQELSTPRRYHTVKKQLNSIWKFWTRNYLTSLQARTKWKSASPNLEKGDLVILIEDSPPPLWKIGVIIQTFPDSAGNVRTVQVKTASGTTTRPVQKLCILPKEL